MTNNVNMELINTLKFAADMQKGNGNGELETSEKEAIEVFKASVENAKANKTINDATYKEAMGLYITKPEAEPIEKKLTYAEKKAAKAEKRADEKYEKAKQKSVKERIQDNVKTIINYGTIDNKPLEALVANLENHFINDNYDDLLNDVKEIVDLIQKEGFNSKQDIEKLNKNIKKENLNDFQKDILGELIKLAKEEQIQKETAELKKVYLEIRKENEGKVENYTEILNKVKEKTNDSKLKKSYYDEAFARLNNEVMKEIMDRADIKRSDMIAKGSNNTTEKMVREALLDTVPESDTLQAKVIKADKEGNKLTARHNDRNRTAERLKNVTLEELKKELGNNIVMALDAKYIVREDVNKNNVQDINPKADCSKVYLDVSSLSKDISERVGYDVFVNRSTDYQLSEIRHVKAALKDLTGVDFSNEEVKKILKLCHIPEEPRDRNFWRAFLSSIAPSLGELVAGAAIGGTSVTQNTTTSITLKADNLANFIAPEGVDVIQNSDGSITITSTATQMVKGCGPLLGALAGLGFGVALGTIMNLIIGMEKNESTCFSLLDFNLRDEKFTNFDKYAEHVRSKEENPKRAELIIQLAEAYKNEYGENWAKEYDADLKLFAGQGSTLNCLEFEGGRLVRISKIKKTEENKGNNQKETPAPIAYSTAEAVYKKPVKEKMLEIDGSKTSWGNIVKMYGSNCLVPARDKIDKNKYPNCYKRYNELAIRFVKVAQAINDDNYTLDRLMDLAEKTFAAKNWQYTELKDYPGIDHDVLVGTMKGDWLGMVKVPDKLGNCNRKTIQAENATGMNTEGATNKPVAPAVGHNIKYENVNVHGYRFDNGDVEVFTNENERNTELEKKVKKQKDAGKEVYNTTNLTSEECKNLKVSEDKLTPKKVLEVFVENLGKIFSK